MTTDNEKIVVISEKNHRKGARYYFDFMDSTLLNGEEKILFLALKRYLDYSMDDGGTGGEVWPSINTLSKQMGWERKKVIRTMDSLVRKKVVKKIRRGLTKSNLYIIRDYSSVWRCNEPDQVEAAITAEKFENTSTEEMIEELRKRGLDISYKEKEPTTAPTKVTEVSPKSSIYTSDYKESENKSQDNTERYSADVIREFYEYDIMVYDHPEQREMIDTVMNILYDTLNSTKPMIRVDGQERPSMVVQAKLLKLDRDAILYAIRKYQEQTDRVKQPVAYMLTILYKAREQMELDIANQVKHDMSHPVMDQ